LLVKGRQYKLDCSKWIRYKNFKNVYEGVKEELVDAGLAVELTIPIYMDQVGIHVKGKKRKERIKGLKVKCVWYWRKWGQTSTWSMMVMLVVRGMCVKKEMSLRPHPLKKTSTSHVWD
jgi:hypothetical protein